MLRVYISERIPLYHRLVPVMLSFPYSSTCSGGRYGEGGKTLTILNIKEKTHGKFRFVPETNLFCHLGGSIERMSLHPRPELSQTERSGVQV